VVPGDYTDPYLAYADAYAPRFIVGKLLKFSKGDYTAGEADETVALGKKLIAALDEMLVGWVRWEAGKPTNHIMTRVEEGKQPPKREQLGDNDPIVWELDSSRQPRDPWQWTNYVPMLDEQHELYTFTTSSRGGASALGSLLRQYSRHRRLHPNEYPVIELGVGSYQHAKKEYGRVKYPEFKVVGWVARGEVGADAGTLALSSSEGNEQEPVAPGWDQEIPF
jgi:hypothetical protein